MYRDQRSLLYIDNNDLLTNIDALESLTSIGGDLGLSYNDLLTNLDGLQNLTKIDESVFLELNPQLNEFCGLHTLLTSPENGVEYFLPYQNQSELTEADVINGGPCERILPAPAEGLPALPSAYLVLLGLGVLGIGGLAMGRVL